MTARPAVFLDRDGTLIEDRHYLKDPDLLHLLPGAADAVRRLNLAHLPVVVVTNQSGIARGLLSEADYEATARRLETSLAANGARLDGQYHCPHLPSISGPCACRKPGPELYERAARDLELDLGSSWWIGDRERDIAAADHFGGHALLVLTGAGRDELTRLADAARRAVPDILAAVDVVLGSAA
jgi:D-glycero-D-manno-heptose 1,7-bisphosphate phosphatase